MLHSAIKIDYNVNAVSNCRPVSCHGVMSDDRTEVSEVSEPPCDDITLGADTTGCIYAWGEEPEDEPDETVAAGRWYHLARRLADGRVSPPSSPQ
jgi:hypothetical protein